MLMKMTMFIWGFCKMRIRCLHGYFIFQDLRLGQISDFVSRFGLDLVSVGDYYTFSDIATAPKYSLKGKTILGQVATSNFEGHPWEVFEKNGLAYDFDKGLVLPIINQTQITTIQQAGNRFTSPGLILPGSVTADGDRVRDYSAWYSRDTLRFLYSEVVYV